MTQKRKSDIEVLDNPSLAASRRRQADLDAAIAQQNTFMGKLGYEGVGTPVAALKSPLVTDTMIAGGVALALVPGAQIAGISLALLGGGLKVANR